METLDNLSLSVVLKVWSWRPTAAGATLLKNLLEMQILKLLHPKVKTEGEILQDALQSSQVILAHVQVWEPVPSNILLVMNYMIDLAGHSKHLLSHFFS